MQVIVMRGLPGSGKSFWVENRLRRPEGFAGLENSVIVCSNDDYHVNFATGRYEFKQENHAAACNECTLKFLNVFIKAVNANAPDGCDYLVVDNTNLSAWEIAPYYRIAECHCIPVKIVRIHCEYVDAVRRNVHAVPPERIWAMYQTLLQERLPPWWKEEVIV